jgi:hypothetical protein
MKTNKKNQFLDELKKVPIIQVACEKTGISRQTYYRWANRSKEFKTKAEESLKEGVSFVNDMSETQLLNLIKSQDFKAISFWLKHRNDNYKQKIEVITKEDIQELSPEQKKIVKEALELASITVSPINNNK